MLLVNSLVLFLSSILRGTVRCHQKWDLQCEVSLEMAGLHFYIDKIHNLYHENASLLDHNRCCQSEKHKNTFIQDPVSVRARIIVYVCHALLLVIKICRIGNNKTLDRADCTNRSDSYLISLSWLWPVFCSLVMSDTATQCFPGV